MHEISIIQGALEMAIQSAQNAAATRIDCLRLRVGTMTGVVPEALQFAFEALREGTIAAQATLEVETVPARCWCRQCELEFESADWLQECPRCHRGGAELRHGLELEVASMEVT